MDGTESESRWKRGQWKVTGLLGYDIPALHYHRQYDIERNEKKI